MIFIIKNEADNKTKFEIADEASADYALIPIKEYHGYENALRILREKSLLNAEKGKADEHGYTLKTAVQIVKKEYDATLWKISVETPYALKIGLENAVFLIEKDLRAFYGMPDPQELPDQALFWKSHARMFTKDRIVSWDKIYAIVKTAEYELENSAAEDPQHAAKRLEEYGALVNLHEKYLDRIILGIDSITANYGSGRFQVTYLATALAEAKL